MYKSFCLMAAFVILACCTGCDTYEMFDAYPWDRADHWSAPFIRSPRTGGCPPVRSVMERHQRAPPLRDASWRDRPRTCARTHQCLIANRGRC